MSTDERPHVNRYALAMSTAITFSSFAYGYAGAVIATTLTQPSFNETMGLDTASNADSLIGAINGLFYGGGVVGAFVSGWVSNRWGRKAATALGNLLVLIAGAVMTGSVNPAMFICFRFVSGLGAFLIVASVPVWIAELAPPKIRGIMVDVHAVSMMAGYAVATYAGLGFYFVTGDDAWRGPMGLSIAWPFFILCGIYWLPESPRFLIAAGRQKEAWEVIKRMHANREHDPEHNIAKREMYQIQRQLEVDRRFDTSYMAIVKQASLFRRAWMTVLLELFIMSSGVLVILNNGSIIWRGLGFSTVQILNLQAGFQLCGLVFNILAMTFVDRIKRDWIMAIGLVGCAIVMMAQMLLQKFYLSDVDQSGLYGATAMIFLFQATYSLFLDGASYFYIAEIWPSHLRSQGFAIGMAALCLFNMMWLLAAPTAIAEISWAFYLFFIIIPVIGAVMVMVFYPDTLGKPLEEIAAMFGDEDAVAVFQSDVTDGDIRLEQFDLGVEEKPVVVERE
ncbi:general substrate transporter [Aspergillus unguis]